MDFELLTDHAIPARRPDLQPINKKKKLGIAADYQVKMKGNKKLDKYLDLA